MVAAALFDAQGRVLIAERPAGKHMAGWWEFPGGKVAAGESDSHALVRELREELGIEAHALAEIMTLSHEYPDRIVELVLWRAMIASGTPQPLDGQQLKWVHPRSLADEKLLPADAPFIAALQNEVPQEVCDFLDAAPALNDAALGIGILDRARSAEPTDALRAGEVAARLGLIQLDKADEPHPYCYITRGVAAGMVIHYLNLEPAIRFVSLAGFESFLRERKRKREGLWANEVPTPAHPDQLALGREIGELGSQPDDEASTFLAYLYLPMLRSDPAGVLEPMSRHRNLFIREATADVLGIAQIPGTRGLLDTLAEDPVSQVSFVAKRALSRWTP